MRPRTRRRASISYIGLEGPTDAALAELKKAGMPVICDQNPETLAHKDDPIIVGWMHADEPDNAQEVPGSKGYGPPVLPAKIIAEYEAFRNADPSRGRCCSISAGAWPATTCPDRDGRSHHPEDYPEYLKGCDIGSFDIYPVAHYVPAVRGQAGFRRPGRRAADQVDRRAQAHLELHGMHAHPRGRQADAEAGQSGSLDRPGAREPGNHLLLPSVPAQGGRPRAAGRCGDARRGGGDQHGRSWNSRRR